MRVLAAIDSFKGCASSFELNQAALAGFSAAWEKINVPISDGGEGCLVAIQAAIGGQKIMIKSVDPLYRVIEAPILITTIQQQRAAIIVSADFVGLHQTIIDDLHIKQSSSFGLGLAIQAALTQKVQAIYITLGGTGTSDGGLGLLASLLPDFLPDFTHNKNPLLEKINHFNWECLKYSPFSKVKLIGLTDVNNPYSGPQGFAPIFAQQKGASLKTIAKMDQQAEIFKQKIQQHLQLDLNEIPGTGAAGGLGGALSLLNGQLQAGFPTISHIIQLEKKIKTADLILTGEGSLDAQSNFGKVPYGIAKLAQTYNVPVIALAGKKAHDLGQLNQLLTASFCIHNEPVSLAQAMDKKRTLANLKNIASNIERLYLTFQDRIKTT